MLQVQLVIRRLPGGEDNLYDVIPHVLMHLDLIHQLARAQNFLNGHQRPHLGIRPRKGHRVQNLPLLRKIRIPDHHLEHEAVHLRLGQRIRTFLINRILRGQHQKRRGQRQCPPAQRHLPLLHGFEQRALHLRRRAVDFIRQHQVRKHRPLGGAVLALLRIVNQRADNVRRQEVGGKLNAAEFRVNGRGQRPRRQGFGQPGHAFQQHVAIGEQAHQQPVHQILLTHNGIGNFGAQPADPGRGRGNAGIQFGRRQCRRRRRRSGNRVSFIFLAHTGVRHLMVRHIM